MDFLGASLQLAASVQDQNGNALSGVTLVWSSSAPAVATVDQTGRVTALSAGPAVIRASAGSVFGDATVTVSPAPCAEEIALAPGESKVVPATCAISIPAGAAGDRYRVAVLNQNLAGFASSVTDVTLTVSASAAAADVPSAPALVTRTAQRPRISLSARDRRNLWIADGIHRKTRAVHMALRESEAALLDALGPQAVLPSRAASIVGAPQPVDLPAKLSLRPNPGDTCSETGAPLRTALLLGQNDDLAVYQDSAQNASSDTEVTAAHAQRIMDFYSTYGKATIDDYYPGMPDVDGNGKVILYVSFDDALADGATAAYVWGGDLLSSGECAASNQAELTYFNAALIRELDEGFDQAMETMVHEAKHIVSFWQGIARSRRLGTASYQPSWIEEGSAELAANMAGRRAWAALGGPAPNDLVNGQDFIDADAANNGSLPSEIFGIILRLFRAQGYLSSQPNGLIISPDGAGTNHSVYGSGWTFLRWLGDAYGGAAAAAYGDRTLFATQNDSLTPAGTQGLLQVTGEPDFSTLLEKFATAVLLHSEDSAPSTGDYTSYDFVDAIELFCFAADDPCDGQSAGPAGAWPWPVTATRSGPMYAPFAAGSFTGKIGPTGMRIHEFRSEGTSGVSLRVQAVQPVKVVVARVQ
jgi:hypothetical protein